MFKDNGILKNAIEEENELKESAESVGLNINIPSVGSAAYERLKGACLNYTDAVINFNYTTSSPNLSTNEKAKQNSERERRSTHNQLCVMLFGTPWYNTSEEDRNKISNFAVTVGGREDYVGTF